MLDNFSEKQLVMLSLMYFPKEAFTRSRRELPHKIRIQIAFGATRNHSTMQLHRTPIRKDSRPSRRRDIDRREL